MTDVDRTSHGEARGYSWPPFEPGNKSGRKLQPGHEVTTTHGAWSPRKISPVANEYLEWIAGEIQRDASPISYLADASYFPRLRRWAQLNGRLDLIYTWLDELITPDRPGDLDGDGEVRKAAEYALRLEGMEQKASERLGLDPVSRARILKDGAGARVQLDLAQLFAELGDRVDDGDVEGGDDGGS